MKTKLTNTIVEKLKPQAQRYEVWDTDFKGLHIRVSPGGDKVWYLHYRIDGQRKKYRLGRDLTVAQAKDAVSKGAPLKEVNKKLKSMGVPYELVAE